MSKPIILQDVDGCVLDWLSKFPEFLVKKNLDPSIAASAYAQDAFLSPAQITGLPEPEAMALVEEYNASEYMKYLTPFKDALSVVNLLKEEFDFVAVTAIGRHESSAKYRMENLQFWFPDAFKEIHVVSIGESKYDILKNYDRTFFIDDTPAHIAEAKRAGHLAIRIVRDVRPDTVNAVRYSDYHQIGSFIEANKNIL